jgi:DNA-binding NtrC family response regulator
VTDDTRPKVLYVDDETAQAEDMIALMPDVMDIELVADPETAEQRFRDTSYDLILMDIDLQSEINGIELLRRVKEFDPELPVVMLTKYEDPSHIIDSIKSGAFYYVTKGKVPSIQQIAHISQLAIQDARNRRAAQLLDDAAAGSAMEAMIGESPAMEFLRKEIRRVAPDDCTVLITGESGTGKELVARAIHEESGRDARGGRLVPMNCAGITATLAESTLFGHVRGSFTDAVRDRTGKLQYADRGTLFLDEIADMPGEVQPKLLRALQEHMFEKVGANTPVRFTARVVAATARDLEKLVESDRFRGDLYHRLIQYRIHVPALRERRSDIPLIAMSLVARRARLSGRDGLSISNGALNVLASRDWKRNNVRELENVLIGAILRCDGGVIQAEHIEPEGFGLSEIPATYEDASRVARGRFKTAYFTHLLRIARGSVSDAAAMAGLNEPAFRKHVRDLGLDPRKFRD